MGHPDYVYKPWPDERRDAARTAALLRIRPDRDPRLSPEPGDIVEKVIRGDIVIRAKVTDRWGRRVFSTVQFADGTWPPATSGTLGGWIKWAADAKVVLIAER